MFFSRFSFHCSNGNDSNDNHQDYMPKASNSMCVYPFRLFGRFVGNYFWYFPRCSTKSLWRKYSECIAKSRCSRMNACVFFCRSFNDWYSCFCVLSSYLMSRITHITQITKARILRYSRHRAGYSYYRMRIVICSARGLQRNFCSVNNRRLWLSCFAHAQADRYCVAASTLSTAFLASDSSRRIADPSRLSDKKHWIVSVPAPFYRTFSLTLIAAHSHRFKWTFNKHLYASTVG